MIKIDPDWWKSLFDEVYLLTDAPFVCNPELTKQETTVVEKLLNLLKEDRILDLCGGQGRHSLELARRCYQNIVVLDYSNFLIQRGVQEAAEAGLDVKFSQGDARDINFPSANFDVVLLMANSFGYFANAADDRRVLTQVCRVLTNGGRLLLDLVDREFALSNFRPESWHEATDDIVVCWKRELVQDTILVREMVLSKSTGMLRDRTYTERLYSQESLHNMLLEVGFTDVKAHNDLFVHNPDVDTDYGLATHRLLITATK